MIWQTELHQRFFEGRRAKPSLKMAFARGNEMDFTANFSLLHSTTGSQQEARFPFSSSCSSNARSTSWVSKRSRDFIYSSWELHGNEDDKRLNSQSSGSQHRLRIAFVRRTSSRRSSSVLLSSFSWF